MDCIYLHNMLFYGYHGVLDAEQELGQRFMLDVRLYLDLTSAGRSDDLRQTVNYAEVYEVVKDIVENRRFRLIETLAETIAQQVLSSFPVEQTAIAIRKPAAPIAGILDYAEVSLVRSRKV